MRITQDNIKIELENENETYYGDYILLTKVELLGGKVR